MYDGVGMIHTVEYTGRVERICPGGHHRVWADRQGCHQGVGHIYRCIILCVNLNGIIARNADFLYQVGKWRHLDRELACEGVGQNHQVDRPICGAAGRIPCPAVHGVVLVGDSQVGLIVGNSVGCSLHHILLIEVIARCGIQSEGNACPADIGLAQSEAQGFVSLDVTADHTARNAHLCLVEETHIGQRLRECIGLADIQGVFGKTSRGLEAVAGLEDLYIVVADGHGNREFSLAIGPDDFAVPHTGDTVYHQFDPAHGDIGIGKVDGAAYGEGADILERDAVVRQGVDIDDTRGVLRRELMRAIHGANLIGRTASGKGYAADKELSLVIGSSVEGQLVLCGHLGSRTSSPTYHAIVVVGRISRLGIVVGILRTDAFIQRPVGNEVVFLSAEHTVVIFQQLGIRQIHRPQAHIVDAAVEAARGITGAGHHQAVAGVPRKGSGFVDTFPVYGQCRRVHHADGPPVCLAPRQRDIAIDVARQIQARRVFGTRGPQYQPAGISQLAFRRHDGAQQQGRTSRHVIEGHIRSRSISYVRTHVALGRESIDAVKGIFT